jgi:dTDP-4-dehydrorhamnose reductase
MKPIVLGYGLLGKEIVNQTNWDFLSRKKDGIDANDIETMIPILSKYDTIINCIAHTDTYSKEKDQNWSVNYAFVDKLIDYSNLENKKLIHISTDYIYANSISNASENDVPVHIRTWYGYTKLLGDSLIQLRSKNYLICRLSHKPYPFPYEQAWSDIITNGDYVNIIAELVINLINKNSSGVFNVGTDEKSIYDLALKTKNVTPCFKPDYVPYDTTMCLDKLKKEI